MSAKASVVPTLLEVQRAMRRSLLAQKEQAEACVVPGGLTPAVRLAVYRNTMMGTLTAALRLSYPAVYRLVGREFFEGAAHIFVEKDPPHSAYVDEYGGSFPEFLGCFPPALSLAYLPGVARLEWAVSRAFHAADVAALDPSRLLAVDPAAHCRIVFTPNPSNGLVRADHPVDAIWRAVLARDDAALAAIDLGSGPVWLLVQRVETGVDVARISESEWRFVAQLCAGRPLQAALDEAALGLDASAALAGHLAAGRFIGFRLAAAR
jgi:hypothetical protein